MTNTTYKNIIATCFLLISILITSEIQAKKVINIQPQEGDMTLTVRNLIEEANDKDIEIVFEKGTYRFNPDYAYSKYCFITNHENGYKKIVFPFENYDAVTITGNGAEFIFHGRVLPFLFENCKKVNMSGVTIDWDIPFLFEGEVMAVNETEKWIEMKPYTDGFSWKLQKGKIIFPNIDGFNFSKLGSTLPFDVTHKRVSHGAYDASLQTKKVEQKKNGVLRLYLDNKMRSFPPVGSILNSKGAKGENRYAPAVHVIKSKNIAINKVTVHHALGMGFLAEKSEDITISNCGIYVREGSKRVVSIIADATHFCNCKGDVLVENCRFEQMLDDGTNVHGTYTKVNKIIDKNTLIVGLEHFQQSGFDFAEKGDEMWFIHQPNPQRATTNTVKSTKTLNDKYIQITFENELPKDLKQGDLLENKTWNPTFTMRGCTIEDHRARNIVIKTPKKIVIENNKLSSMMSSILFRGESFYWYESGNVEDVLIQNNHFKYCAYSGAEHAVMYVTPRLAKSFDKTIFFDRNIRFIDNTIETFDNRIVIADRVDGLIIKGNTIIHTPTSEALYPDAPMFELINCTNVEITKNKYKGDNENVLKTDEVSKEKLKMKRNKGF